MYRHLLVVVVVSDGGNPRNNINSNNKQKTNRTQQQHNRNDQQETIKTKTINDLFVELDEAISYTPRGGQHGLQVAEPERPAR